MFNYSSHKVTYALVLLILLIPDSSNKKSVRNRYYPRVTGTFIIYGLVSGYMLSPSFSLFIDLTSIWKLVYDIAVANYTVVNFVISPSTETYGPKRNLPPCLLFLSSWSLSLMVTSSHHLSCEQTHGHNLPLPQPCFLRTALWLSFSHLCWQLMWHLQTFHKVLNHWPVPATSPLPHTPKPELFWELLIHVSNEDTWVDKNKAKDSHSSVLKKKTPLR